MDFNIEELEWDSKGYIDFLEYLKSITDEKYQKFHASLLPEGIELIGIRTPELKNIALRIRKSKPKEYLKYFFEYAASNKKAVFYDELMIAGFVISYMSHSFKGIKRKPFGEIKEYIDCFVKYIDNWAVCDMFCSNLRIKAEEQTEVFNYAKKYIASERTYEIRFGVVMLLAHFISEDKCIEILEIIFGVKSKEYYVNMAVAWCASMCYVKHSNTAGEYILKLRNDYIANGYNEDEKFTFNMMLSKIRDSRQIKPDRKEYIKTLRLD